jgi:rRNA maturation RNase YbeY
VAEVYISTDRVKENAATHGVTYTNEMLRVLFHGALHLCGYKDKSKADILTMRAKEDAYLKRYTKM